MVELFSLFEPSIQMQSVVSGGKSEGSCPDTLFFEDKRREVAHQIMRIANLFAFYQMSSFGNFSIHQRG